MIPSWFPAKDIPDLQVYTDFEKISEGGFGEVYLLHMATEPPRRVVLKRLRPLFVNVPSTRHLFEREARILKKLNFPLIPRFVDGYLSDEECFFIMEYVEGKSSWHLIRNAKASGKTIPTNLALKIVRGVCPSLQYLHSILDENGKPDPMAHGDLKPRNILVSEDARSHLIDFSLASQASNPLPENPGTATYMAPERYAGEKPLPSSDIFSLGLTFFELLTLRPLLGEKTHFGNFQKMLSKKHLEEISSCRFPAAIEDFLRQALAYDAKDRIHSAAEMEKQFDAVAQHLSLDMDAKQMSRLLREHLLLT